MKEILSGSQESLGKTQRSNTLTEIKAREALAEGRTEDALSLFRKELDDIEDRKAAIMHTINEANIEDEKERDAFLNKQVEEVLRLIEKSRELFEEYVKLLIKE